MKKLSFKGIVNTMVLNACMHMFRNHVNYDDCGLATELSDIEYKDDSSIIATKDFTVTMPAINCNDVLKRITVKFNGFIASDGEIIVSGFWINNNLAVCGDYKRRELITDAFGDTAVII